MSRLIDVLMFFLSKDNFVKLLKQCFIWNIAFFILFCLNLGLPIVNANDLKKIQSIQLNEVEQIFKKTQRAISHKEIQLIRDYLSPETKVEVSLKGISFLSKSYSVEEYLDYLKKVFEHYKTQEIQVYKLKKIQIGHESSPTRAQLELKITQASPSPDKDFSINIKQSMILQKIQGKVIATELWVEAECPCPSFD